MGAILSTTKKTSTNKQFFFFKKKFVRKIFNYGPLGSHDYARMDYIVSYIYSVYYTV